MKKTIAMALTVLLVLNLSISLPSGMLIANAESVTENWIVFDTGTGTITDYTGSATTLVIPSTINGVAVTSIGYYAFIYCSLTSVTIPNSVTSIGDHAFDMCSSLTNITMPDSLTSIGDYAFIYCFSLTSVTIPDGVTSIGDYAFYNCSSLTNIIIPDGVTSICDSVFMACTSLTSVTILGSVTSIGDGAFSGSPLTSITIPDSVLSIGDDAFSFCALTSVTIPANVTSIGVSPFVCDSLISIDVNPANQNYSSANEILYDKNKTVLVEYPSGISGSVTIPGSVTSIGEAAFRDSSLTSITIPNSVTSIGDGAFWNCSSLASIIIPDGVTSIGDRVFMDCSSLTRVTIPNSVTSIGIWAFAMCSSLTSIIIPDGVTSIGDFAFMDCSSLTSIIIPNSVTSIGDGAFAMCSSLTIYGYESSYAQTYAADNRILFSTDLPNIDPTYTVIIPSSVTIGESGGIIEIKGSNINTLPDETVYVKISNGINASGIISLTNQSDSITSIVSNSKGAINTDTVVASFITDETSGGTLKLSKPADTSNKRAGTYTGTLTFTVAMGILS